MNGFHIADSANRVEQWDNNQTQGYNENPSMGNSTINGTPMVYSQPQQQGEVDSRPDGIFDITYAQQIPTPHNVISNVNTAAVPVHYPQPTVVSQQQQYQQQPQQVRFTVQQNASLPVANSIVRNGVVSQQNCSGNINHYANSSARQLLGQPVATPSVISIEEALAQLADEDAAMWNEPSIVTESVAPVGPQNGLQPVIGFRNNSESFGTLNTNNRSPSPAKVLGTPAKRCSPLQSMSDDHVSSP